MRCFVVIIFSSLGVLAGCAASPPSTATTQRGYAGRVVAVRQVVGGALTDRITELLGRADDAQGSAGQEIVVRLQDGEVKSFVPPPGQVPARLAPGDEVRITETPSMRISLR